MALTDEARNAIADEAWAVAEKMKPSAASLDANRSYPDDHLDALAVAGLTGLLVSPDHGGHGGDLTSLALACEAVGWANGSTGLVFLMHLCGTATIGAKATAEQNLVQTVTPKGFVTVNENAVLKEVGKFYHVCPTFNGGRDWPSSAYNPKTNVLYVTLINLCIDLRALDADNGQILWQTRLASQAAGGTITYSVNGRQYVAIPAGGGGINAAAVKMTPEVDSVSGGNAVYVFALPQ